MRVAVILSTYNQPKWLQKSLWGFAAQSYSDFTIVIADDGSGEETLECIENARRETKLNIHHIWHEDRGFRKCTILNKATLASDADYLIFSDGDCIPRRDFVEQHVRRAQHGVFLSGGYVKLPMAVSEAVTRDDILTGRATDPKWLIERGVPKDIKLWKLTAGPIMGRLLDWFTPTKGTWNGHNSSTFRDEILRVNGFDERMEWGGEDRELGERLIHNSVVPRIIRHQAICVHLDHARFYVREDALRRNNDIREATRVNKSKWTDFGMRKTFASKDSELVVVNEQRSLEPPPQVARLP